ncbi:MAG: Hdr-like menaquinol oxidoreductase cytochrome c [Rhodospirillaceae bacterium]|nr:MAG: Hdr-like menaquinol oxidoreductase cytochrome c [Rhodospirillaceae bacterium]TNC96468.1 MAG: Hdr-like menaquinol oxidoreductase cytochrome c subunit [Stygiobacter sp.]
MGMRVVMLALLLVLMPWQGARAAEAGPQFPKAQGQCVEDAGTMRRHHFDFLKHQRDDTMREGIRGAKHSLKDCVSCHAAHKDGKAVPVNAPGQFCAACHDYAAVSVGCFTCHATTPGEGKP